MFYLLKTIFNLRKISEMKRKFYEKMIHPGHLESVLTTVSCIDPGIIRNSIGDTFPEVSRESEINLILASSQDLDLRQVVPRFS
jgi:hypothetical protein